ncbi:polysaccharide deacetylase family protein [Saccharopolyspora spinosa]|uniref:Peptidoglycan/xylan/chitin deacetylase (PgdA/CDA1 family) n=1 Tax=Saccharopolyspora spinosa TaxID=60894 RepID=A0A2N3Y0N7_SACSN|nr:peptidoglycan/xylan/chitin deacetylase (PgdA/CDA1 family) [Saccharopolyspora spinosa]
MNVNNDRLGPWEDEVGGPVRDLIGYGRHGVRSFWPDGAKAAVAIVVNFETGAEASWPSGDRRNDRIFEFPYALDPRYRDLATESVSEYGGRAGIWRIARLLDEYDVKTTFSGCAVAFARNPEVGAYVKEAGHEPGCHGWRWEEAWTLSRQEERERIAAAVQLIEESCGQRPLGWQTRHSGSTHTRELVVEEGGFLYDSDAYNDDIPYFVNVAEKKHLVIPYSSVYNDHRFVIAQGYSEPADFFKTCKHGLDFLRHEGETHPKMMTIGIHAHWMGQASRASALQMFLEYVRELGDVWVAPRVDIARWWIDHHHEFGYEQSAATRGR